MTTFKEFHDRAMDVYAKALNHLQNGTSGHLWTGRLELAGLIESTDDWIKTHAQTLLDHAQAKELRDLFASHPQAGYPMAECLTNLRGETLKWTNGKGHT